MDKIEFSVLKPYDTFTIKEFLKEYNVGRAKVEEIRVNKAAFLNGKQVNLETVMHAGDLLSFAIDEEIDIKPSKESVDVIYEDDYLLIVNKPSGLIVHSDGNDKENVCSRVARYYLEHNIKRKVRYAHRLDEETTGILIFAKDFGLSKSGEYYYKVNLSAYDEQNNVLSSYDCDLTIKYNHKIFGSDEIKIKEIG